uniref:DNA-directed RNA polymerase III subunit RPC5 n=1 Tax=Candidozyma auris TaxID=498019 RepID=A0A0L0P500_CANAR
MDKKDLFVAEDEDVSESPALDEYQDTNDVPMDEEEDDPVILTMPILHGSLPHRSSQSLHVLQYANRPKSRPFDQEPLKSSIKMGTKVLEVKVPMDTNKFYDEGRAEELGSRVTTSNLNGVLTGTDGGLYVGHIIERDGDLQMVLVPVDSTAQLKPLFKYIDDLESARTAHTRQEVNTLEPAKQNAVHVLQTAAKASNQLLSEGHVGGLGSCLKHVKKFDEEPWNRLSWRCTDDSSAQRLLEHLKAPSREVIETSTTFDEFA